jgi:hypothetical protein
MSKTKQFQNDDNAMQRAFASGNMGAYGKADDTLLDRQYSRRTYMGLSKG